LTASVLLNPKQVESIRKSINPVSLRESLLRTESDELPNTVTGSAKSDLTVNNQLLVPQEPIKLHSITFDKILSYE